MAADDDSDAERPALSLDKIALELSNPVTGLRSFGIDYEYRTFQGDFPESEDQKAARIVLTPSWPFKLSNGKNILLSATIPLNGDQPIWKEPDSTRDYAEFLIRQSRDISADTGEFITGHDHLGDIEISLGYGGVNENGFISMFGLASSLPSSEDRSAGRDQALLGPEIMLGQVTSWGLMGARLKHLTDVGDRNDFDTNETTVKLSFAYGLGNGRQIESNPIVLYDWEAVSGNEWTVPIGAGLSNTFMIGSVPAKLALNIEYYVVSPDRFGPEWKFTISLTPVMSTKLLK